jgi:type I restriction enzyme M protein
MDQSQLNWLTNFIWGIADDVLRDLFKRGKYPDVILPMCVIRRMDAVLEADQTAGARDQEDGSTKLASPMQTQALCDAAGQAFYNTSKFTLRDLRSRGSQQQLLADFEDYLNGFSPNVQDILDNFKFRESAADALEGRCPWDADQQVPRPWRRLLASRDRQPRHGDGLRRAGPQIQRREQRRGRRALDAARRGSPRWPIWSSCRSRIRSSSGTYLLYDCACGTGGMLTVAEETLTEIAASRNQQVDSRLYGQEINPETYAVCKADMLLKGRGENANNIVGGAEWSTLAHDAFPGREFDFMIANPPYGKSWKKDLESMGGKDGMRDPRFKVMHDDEELSLVTRSSDGQMLFLANMASKMNSRSPLGSRIAEVHNGSSLFTGDAGQGESNIRRWIIENDWLEAIVALPLNLFYNTGIATYIWVLSQPQAGPPPRARSS